MAAPHIVGSARIQGHDATINSIATFTALLPDGTEIGDALIVVPLSYSANDDGGNYEITPLFGDQWTPLSARTSSGTLMYRAFAATYTETLDRRFRSNQTGDRRVMPATVAIRGGAPVEDWVLGEVHRRVEQPSSTSTMASGVLTSVPETLVLGLFAERTTASETDVSGVTGATKHAFLYVTDGPIETLTVTYTTMPSAGKSPDVTVAYPNTQASNGIGQQIAIPPVAASGNTPPTAAFTLTDDGLTVSVDGSSSSDPDGPIASYEWTFGDGQGATGVTAEHTYDEAGTYTISLTVTDGVGATDVATETVYLAPRVPTPVLFQTSHGLFSSAAYIVGSAGPVAVEKMRPLGPGYMSVEQMLDDPIFYMAHRGGSRDFPEMTMHAYTQAVVHGYPVLEISMARTSDGVWFGLHDQNLTRTSPGAPSVDASTLTWRRVQQYLVSGSTASANPGQQPRPYLRWEDLVAAYGSTHILFVDPKYRQQSHRAEFLSMLANDVGTDRAVVKYHYSGAALGAASRAAGFLTWGYYYNSELNADPNVVTNTHANWDILGLDYGATQANWDHILSFGKHVVAHICPDQAAVDTAIAKGARGLQISGVKAIVPPPIPRRAGLYDSALYDESVYL